MFDATFAGSPAAAATTCSAAIWKETGCVFKVKYYLPISDDSNIAHPFTPTKDDVLKAYCMTNVAATTLVKEATATVLTYTDITVPGTTTATAPAAAAAAAAPAVTTAADGTTPAATPAAATASCDTAC